jgi:hypothetical protein
MIDRGSLDQFKQIRQRRAGWVWPEADVIGGGVPAFVGQVTSSSSIIGVGDFLLVQPNSVLGQEAEGGSGVFTPFGSSTVAVYLVGPAKALTGDYLVCKFVDNRWVAERFAPSGGGGGGVTIPSCFCTSIPATLSMTSADPSCNYNMFQSCTIQYGPTPSGFLSTGIGDNSFLSTEGFPDPIADGALFYYYLTCQYNTFTLSRIYLVSPYGSPYRDGVLYTWIIGGSGNTCAPFHLDNGQAFAGSDASCSVTIDG